MKDNSAVMLSLVVEPNEDGYRITVPDMQGAFAEGDNIEEAIFKCLIWSK